MIKSATSFKIVVPESVEMKIRHLCSIVHDVEWSGTLFYKYEGSLDDGTFKATCVDLFVMDIGSSAYTEYDESPDVLTYRIEHDLLDEDIQEGLIHSHNNMSTFFSGTDTDTLIEEGTNSNHFVSLIVNNAGVYTAGVTRRITTELKAEAHIKYTENQYYDSFKDERVYLKTEELSEEDREESQKTQYIEWFNLEVEKADVINNFAEIDSRLDEIRKSKVKSKTKTYQNFSNYYSTQKSKETPNKSTPTQGTLFNSYNYGDDYYSRNYEKDLYDEYWDYYGSKLSESKNAKKEVLDDDTPLCLLESFDKDMIKSLALQLLTGSIIVNDKSIDPEKWVQKMDELYERRFGPLNSEKHPEAIPIKVTENNKRLDNWIESMCEFIVYTKDTALLNRLDLAEGKPGFYTESDTAEICAGDLCSYLTTLPKSYVKDKIIEVLTTYLPHGTEEYFISKK